MRFETKAIHAGAATDDETGAIAPPIHLSTTFERRAEDGEPAHGFSYIRDDNPTQQRLEEALAAIDRRTQRWRSPRAWPRRLHCCSRFRPARTSCFPTTATTPSARSPPTIFRDGA